MNTRSEILLELQKMNSRLNGLRDDMEQMLEILIDEEIREEYS